MLVVLLLSGCASGTGSTVHIFGGRSQNGDENDMEAASDVDVKDLIGDIPIGPQAVSSLGRGEEPNPSPAVPVAPPETGPVRHPDVVNTSPRPSFPWPDRHAGAYPSDWVIVKDGPAAFSRAGYPVPTSRFRGRENETYIKPSTDKILMPWGYVKYGLRWFIVTSAGELELRNLTRFKALPNSEALPNDGRVHLYKPGLHKFRGTLNMEDIDGRKWISPQMDFGLRKTNWDFSTVNP